MFLLSKFCAWHAAPVPQSIHALHVGCSRLNRLALSAHHLQGLNTSRCHKLVDMSLCAPKLRCMNMAQCESIEELESAQSFPCLEYLNLYGCIALSTAGEMLPCITYQVSNLYCIYIADPYIFLSAESCIKVIEKKSEARPWSCQAYPDSMLAFDDL